MKKENLEKMASAVRSVQCRNAILTKLAQDASAAPAAQPRPAIDLKAIGDSIKNTYNDQSEKLRGFANANPFGKATLGWAAAGGATMLLAEALRRKRDEDDKKEYFKNLVKGLAYGGLGGAGAYALGANMNPPTA